MMTLTDDSHAPFEEVNPSSVGDASTPSLWEDRLATHKGWQLLELVLVFSPVILALITCRLVGITQPLAMMAVVWVGNLLMLVLIGVGIHLRGESWASIGLPAGSPTVGGAAWLIVKAMLVLIFAVAAFLFGSVVMANLVGIPQPADMTNYNFLQGNLPMLVLSLAGVYVVSSFGEEVVYRGFLISRLSSLFGTERKGGVAMAVLVSSLVFGLAHYEWGAMGVGQTTCMGLALALAFVWGRRNLWPLVLAHGCMDTLLLVQMYAAPA